MSAVPVLIAGAGPSGLAVALELGMAGIECWLVEPRESTGTNRPRAKTTSPRTMELLRRWGLADRLRAAAPLPVSYAQDVVFCTRLTGHEITRFPNAFALHTERRDEFAECAQQIPQPIVERVLREAVAQLPTVRFLLGWRLVSARDSATGVRAEISDREGRSQVVDAAYLIGCDGTNRIGQRVIDASYTGGHGALPNVNITFSAPRLTEDLLCATAVHYWVVGSRPGGILGRLDAHGTWWAIAQGVDASSIEHDPAAVVREMIGADVDVTVHATDPWTARMLIVDRYRGHRTFLVGDAAHLNPPWGGHGYNTSVGDAVNLAWKLVAVLRGWGGPALLDSYEPERRPVAQRTIADAAAQEAHLAHAFTGPGLEADTPEGARRRAAVAEALTAKRSEFYSLGLVLGYHYAGSPVVVDDGSPVPEHDPLRYHGSARPGARLPHRWLSDDRSLYDLLGTGFTLLRLDQRADVAPFREAAASRGVPMDVLDVPEHAESCAAPLVLVRPDQHIAWRGADTANAANVLDIARGAA